jgi:hypothetical protein
VEKFNGVSYIVSEEEAAAVERMRKKCNSPGWNFETLYKKAYPNRDPMNLFASHLTGAPLAQTDAQEQKMHTQFRIAADVRLIGKRRNISPLASDDDSLYYIAKGSVHCTGDRTLCRCSEGCIEVMIQEIFSHDGPLQKYGGACHEQLPTHVLKLHNTQQWNESLIRHAPKENTRKMTKQSHKCPTKSGKENRVRRSERQPTFSSKVLEIINTGVHSGSAKVGSKRGRKRKGGGGAARAIEASKPVTSVVERPGKRRTTKLALN